MTLELEKRLLKELPAAVFVVQGELRCAFFILQDEIQFGGDQRAAGRKEQ
jgi:hypothetical protein